MNTQYTPLTSFIKTLYPIDDPCSCAVVTHPTDLGYWRNYAVTEQQLMQVEQQPKHWYISIASVDATQQGRLRRDRAHLKAAHVVLCDDLGTKAQRAPIGYTWVLETSEGNFQAGWRIEPWDVSDEAGRHYYEACVTALADAGYTDPGARGAYRVMRIPGSIHSSGFKARVVEWHPERVWTLPKLMAALALTPPPHVERASTAIDVPEQTTDPVYEWLQQQGLIVGGASAEAEFMNLRCPWHTQHTRGSALAGYSPLGHGTLPHKRGFRCFHSHHHDISDFLAWVVDQGGPRCDPDGTQEILRATFAARGNDAPDLDQPLVSARQANADKLYAATPYVSPEDLPECERSPKGAPRSTQPATLCNVQYVARAAKLRVRQDMLNHKTVVSFTDDALNALVTRDDDITQLLRDRCTMAGIHNESAVGHLMDLLSWRDPFSPVCEWMGVPWDGVGRFEALADTVTTPPEDADIWRVYLRRWLIQACQAFHNWVGDPRGLEHVLVLIGPQGCGKTTWCSALLPHPWVRTGAYLNLGAFGNDRDAVRKVTTTPIVELGELETTFSRTAAGHQKNFLSQSTDTYRMSYGRTEATYPRTTTYVATANQSDILVDDTGSRRFWLVNVDAADAHHTVDMQQLWAEVRTWWEAGTQWHLLPEEEKVRHARGESFNHVTPIQELVDNYLDTHEGNEVAMNSAQVYNVLADHGLVRNNANTKQLRDALRNRLGAPKDHLNGVRRAWLIPTQVKNTQK